MGCEVQLAGTQSVRENVPGEANCPVGKCFCGIPRMENVREMF